MWWSLSHVQRLWSNQVSTNLSVYCWPKICHSLKLVLFSAAFGIRSSWRSAFLCPGNVSSGLFTNQFIYMSLPVTSCWKISFVAEDKLNRDTENIFLNGSGRPFYLKQKKLDEFCVHLPAWVLRRLGQEGCLGEMESVFFKWPLFSFGRAPFSPKIAPCSAAHWHQQPSKCFKMSSSQQRFIASNWPWVFL